VPPRRPCHACDRSPVEPSGPTDRPKRPSVDQAPRVEASRAGSRPQPAATVACVRHQAQHRPCGSPSRCRAATGDRDRLEAPSELKRKEGRPGRRAGPPVRRKGHARLGGRRATGHLIRVACCRLFFGYTGQPHGSTPSSSTRSDSPSCPAHRAPSWTLGRHERPSASPGDRGIRNRQTARITRHSMPRSRLLSGHRKPSPIKPHWKCKRALTLAAGSAIGRESPCGSLVRGVVGAARDSLAIGAG
jgi:hypothetical protein